MRHIDEILVLPYSEIDFKGQEVFVSDNDTWLYDGEDELNYVLQEKQKDMEFYNSKNERKQKATESLLSSLMRYFSLHLQESSEFR